MLLELAIADAYGAGFEYADPSPERPNDGHGYVQHSRHLHRPPGGYTDDTQSSCAIAECLLANTPMAPLDFASAMVAAYQRDPGRGYARGFKAFLKTVVDGPDFLARIRPDSEKSGAAMRAGPVGLLDSIETVLRIAAIQASLTHATPGGTGAAQGAALMVFHQVRELGPIADLPDFLAAHVPDVDWRHPHRGRTGSKGEEIARTALAVLLDSRSLTDVLVQAVAFGGDTDTVAVIAMAAASVSAEMRRDLPRTLVEGLESGTFGRPYLVELDRRLAAAFDAPIVIAGPGL